MLLYGRVDDAEILLDQAACHLLISKRLGECWIDTLDYRARNLRVLAEHLSDGVGYGPAVTFLTEAGVPPDSPLWTLNHKGGHTHFNP